MISSTNSKLDKKTPWWVKATVVAIIGLLVYAAEKVIDKNFDDNSVQPSITHNHVDSGTLNSVQNNKDVFINSGGQQNNNTDSGEQTIINK